MVAPTRYQNLVASKGQEATTSDRRIIDAVE